MKFRFCLLCLFLCILFFSCASMNRNWEKTQTANSIEAYEKFLRRHPKGQFSDQATLRLENLKNAKKVHLVVDEKTRRNVPFGAELSKKVFSYSNLDIDFGLSINKTEENEFKEIMNRIDRLEEKNAMVFSTESKIILPVYNIVGFGLSALLLPEAKNNWEKGLCYTLIGAVSLYDGFWLSQLALMPKRENNIMNLNHQLFELYNSDEKKEKSSVLRISDLSRFSEHDNRIRGKIYYPSLREKPFMFKDKESYCFCLFEILGRIKGHRPLVSALNGYETDISKAAAIALSRIKNKKEIKSFLTEQDEKNINKYATAYYHETHDYKNALGIGLSYGEYSTNNAKIKSAFGKIPLWHLNFYAERDDQKATILFQFSYGEKRSIKDIRYLKYTSSFITSPNYIGPGIIHYKDIIAYFFNFDMDYLYHPISTKYFRFLIGPGMNVPVLGIKGNEMKGLAGGQIYGDEITSDDVGSGGSGGIGLELVAGLQLCYKNYSLQAFVKYQSKCFWYSEYIEMPANKKVTEWGIFDASGFQFLIGFGIHN